jgi:hypothetical protein
MDVKYAFRIRDTCMDYRRRSDVASTPDINANRCGRKYHIIIYERMNNNFPRDASDGGRMILH